MIAITKFAALVMLSASRLAALRGDLERRLVAAASEQTARWFTAYLKNAIEYRGVKSPAVRTIVQAWGREHGVAALPVVDQLALLDALVATPRAEDKFAAIFWLQLELNADDHTEAVLERVEAWFAASFLYDWSTVDWLCARVVDPLVARDDRAAARVATWRTATLARGPWQRRASIVAFRGASTQPTSHALIRTIVADLLPSTERFVQTGIGWTLADMSKKHPDEARALFEQHFDDLSLEVLQRHTKHLPLSPAERKRWIARKKAAGSAEPESVSTSLPNATAPEASSSSSNEVAASSSSSGPAAAETPQDDASTTADPGGTTAPRTAAKRRRKR